MTGGTYNVMDLFAGINGACYAGKLIGRWRTVCIVEWDKYCQQLTRQRQIDGIVDDCPIWDDIQTFDGIPWRGAVDIITGGFPCQPFSVAGKQQGESDERNMWPDTLRIISEVRPRYAFLENVPALITSGYFGRVIGDLSEIGYDCRWTIVSAADVGAPHLRKRLWLLAYPRVQRCDVRSDTQRGHGHLLPKIRESEEAEQEGDRWKYRACEIGKITWWDVDPADLPDTERVGIPVVFAGDLPVCDCCEEPWCPIHEQHFYECNCVGPTQDGYEYSEDGEMAYPERTGLEGAITEGDSRGERLPAQQDACYERFGAIKSELGRVVNGLPDRCNRLKGLGNAWVPLQAVEAWFRLTGGTL